MTNLARFLFFLVIVRPLVLLVLGLNVRERERLNIRGPAIIAANHNSHLDTLVLISLFPLSRLKYVHPVAAADYFLKNPLMAWFATRIIGIIPIKRAGRKFKEDPFAGCRAALDRGNILVLFPEGSRGEPEQLAEFKTGVAHLARDYPDAPVIPVFLHGLGKALPKGKYLLVPFYVDVFVGLPLRWAGDKRALVEQLEGSIRAMSDSASFPAW